MEFQSFLIGFVVYMIGDVVFSIANYFIQRALFYRNTRKKYDDYYDYLKGKNNVRFK